MGGVVRGALGGAVVGGVVNGGRGARGEAPALVRLPVARLAVFNGLCFTIAPIHAACVDDGHKANLRSPGHADFWINSTRPNYAPLWKSGH